MDVPQYTPKLSESLEELGEQQANDFLVVGNHYHRQYTTLKLVLLREKSTRKFLGRPSPHRCFQQLELELVLRPLFHFRFRNYQKNQSREFYFCRLTCIGSCHQGLCLGSGGEWQRGGCSQKLSLLQVEPKPCGREHQRDGGLECGRHQQGLRRPRHSPKTIFFLINIKIWFLCLPVGACLVVVVDDSIII